MNMDNFDKDIWYLHRKLFHRFVKYAKYFRLATEALPSYQQSLEDEKKTKEERMTASQTHEIEVIDLLTSSSDEVSEDEEAPKVSDGTVVTHWSHVMITHGLLLIPSHFIFDTHNINDTPVISSDVNN